MKILRVKYLHVLTMTLIVSGIVVNAYTQRKMVCLKVLHAVQHRSRCSVGTCHMHLGKSFCIEYINYLITKIEF